MRLLVSELEDLGTDLLAVAAAYAQVFITTGRFGIIIHQAKRKVSHH